MKKILTNTSIPFIRERNATLCILLAFFVGWFLFYAMGTFFNSQRTMDQRPAISSTSLIGIDLQYMHKAVDSYINGDSPYQETNVYPPLTTLVFLPVMLLGTWGGYLLISFLTLLSLVVSILLLDRLNQEKSFRTIPFLFIGISSLVSYGFHFELERGQFSLISMAFLLLSLFSFQHKRVFLAIIFFAVAVQLKITPLLFLPVFLFFRNTVRQKIQFLVGGVILNVLFLFILGKDLFFEFIQALSNQSASPLLWVGNHSLFNFCVSENPLCTEKTYVYLVLVLIGSVISLSFFLYKRRQRGFHSHLFALCGIATLLIPPMSNDYKLSMLPLFLLPVLVDIFTDAVEKRAKTTYVFLFVIVVLYTSTLFPHIYSPFLILSTKTVVLYVLAILLFVAGIRRTHAYALSPESTQKRREKKR